MAAGTAADIALEVLVGLRRGGETFAPSTDTYHELLLSFINKAMHEVQEAWIWQALRVQATITGVAGQSVSTLDSAAQADIDLSPEARLLYEREGNFVMARGFGEKPMLFDTTDTTNYQMIERSRAWIDRQHDLDQNTTVTIPQYFALYRDADDILMRVWPTPTGSRTWQGWFIDPQVKIATTDTFANVTMQVPIRPVWMRALAYALEERGDARAPAEFERAEWALADAMSIEQSDADITGEAV